MNADKLFEEATLNWRDNKGVGTAFVPAPLNDKVLVYKVLSKMYARSPTMTTVIVVNEFGERNQIIEFLTHQNDEENDAEFKKLINDKLIRIFTVEFLIKGSWHSAATLCIWYKPKEYTKNLGVVLYANKCKFRLIVLSKLFKCIIAIFIFQFNFVFTISKVRLYILLILTVINLLLLFKVLISAF